MVTPKCYGCGETSGIGYHAESYEDDSRTATCEACFDEQYDGPSFDALEAVSPPPSNGGRE